MDYLPNENFPPVCSEIFKSTPKNNNEITPSVCSSNPKKRKLTYSDIRGRNLENLLEIYPTTPQASSTLNESLTKEFENIKIEQSYLESYYESAPKYIKTNGYERLVTPPATPKSHFKAFESTPKKLSLFPRTSSACSVPSPLKEQHDILYPNLTPLKKPFSSQKFLKQSPRNRPIESFTTEKKLFNQILNNDIIMDQVFKYLSNGDLFRVSMVSGDFQEALNRNLNASQRYILYKESHKVNKENYKITPPSSPESKSVFSVGSVSPGRQKFAEFVETGRSLNPNQSLVKCPKCNKPSVVEKYIAQCQDVQLCGFIFCQKCESFAYNPDDFYDKCRGLVLGGTLNKKRLKLEDRTNCSPDFNVSSIINSIADNPYHSSGYFSGYDSSYTSLSVKRNLSSSFSCSDSNETVPKSTRGILFSSNSNSSKSVKRDEKKLACTTVPVIQTTMRKKIEMIEPSSPPKIKTYSACSKESRRNLKRLTR
ncbi:hypothetical protein ABEB36_007043 [Hypothenemus hampei]|uniref:Uncharacterized protein n=1 Tax=Hypothenemus hampei TaxID=57062 RepID=A0ABD1ESL8_HYPHA